MTGGLNNASATWVAQRVPDDHVAVTANNFIIRNVDCKDDENFMCSSHIFVNARAAELCSFAAEADFDWQSCYGPDIRTFSYVPGLEPIPWYTTVRLWFVQSKANPGLQLKPSSDPRDFPFSVPVQSKISRTDVMDWMRDHYEGIPFDLTQGILAGPFKDPNRLEGGVGLRAIPGQFARGIPIPRTSYALVVEAKASSKATQSIAWFATDQPDSSVFVPFFAVANECAAPYSIGSQVVFTRDSARWAFNSVANWMNRTYEDMSAGFVMPALRSHQARVIKAVVDLEQQWPEQEQEQVVNRVQKELQHNLIENWWKMGDQLLAAYSDGMLMFENGTKMGLGYPAWWLQMIGFDDTFNMPHWVQPSSQPPFLLRQVPSTFLSAQFARSSLGSFIPGLLTGLVIGAGSYGTCSQPQSQSGPLHNTIDPLNTWVAVMSALLRAEPVSV